MHRIKHFLCQITEKLISKNRQCNWNRVTLSDEFVESTVNCYNISYKSRTFSKSNLKYLLCSHSILETPFDTEMPPKTYNYKGLWNKSANQRCLSQEVILPTLHPTKGYSLTQPCKMSL